MPNFVTFYPTQGAKTDTSSRATVAENGLGHSRQQTATVHSGDKSVNITFSQGSRVTISNESGLSHLGGQQTFYINESEPQNWTISYFTTQSASWALIDDKGTNWVKISWSGNNGNAQRSYTFKLTSDSGYESYFTITQDARPIIETTYTLAWTTPPSLIVSGTNGIVSLGPLKATYNQAPYPAHYEVLITFFGNEPGEGWREISGKTIQYGNVTMNTATGSHTDTIDLSAAYDEYDLGDISGYSGIKMITEIQIKTQATAGDVNLTGVPIQDSIYGGSSSLTASPSSYTFPTAGGSLVVNVTSNVAWEASIEYLATAGVTERDWLSFSGGVHTGSGDGSFTLVAATDTTVFDARSARITITGGGVSAPVSVTQTPVAVVLTASAGQTSFTYAGGTTTITISSNYKWTIE